MKSEDAARRLIGLLASRGCTISLAESCTGGLVSALMTSLPGVSRVFKGAIVAYDDEVKHRMLGVEPGILQGNGSVSEECARAMAIGAAVRFETDFALAITGIAGPEGGSTEKPVGTICFGLASRGTASSVKIGRASCWVTV